MNYEADVCAKQTVGLVEISRQDRTVGENLDAKIASLEIELARLKASKESLVPLLAMRLRDIRSAMDY